MTFFGKDPEMKWYIFWNIFLGDLCAAKFLDGQWYRGKVLKTSATEATILYIDYGNRGTYKYEFEFCLKKVF